MSLQSLAGLASLSSLRRGRSEHGHNWPGEYPVLQKPAQSKGTAGDPRSNSLSNDERLDLSHLRGLRVFPSRPLR